MNKRIKRWISTGLAVVLMLSCIVVPTDVSAETTTNPLLDMVPETRKTYTFDSEEGLLTLPSSVTVADGALVIDTKATTDHRIPLDFQMRNGKTYYVSFDYKIDLAEGQTQLYKQFFFHKSWGKDSYNGTPIYTDGAGNITNQEYTTFIKSFTVADDAFTDAGHRYFWLRVTNGSSGTNSGGKLYIDNLVIYEVGASATFNFDNNLDLLSASHTNFTVENGNLVEKASGFGQKVGFKYTLKADTTYNITVSLRGESNRRVQIYTTSGFVNQGAAQRKTIVNYSPEIGTNYETKTASATFTTDDCANGRDYFWLWFDNPENKGKAYVDYVKIEVAGGSVSFVNGSGTTTSTGAYGAAVEFPKAEAGYVNEFYLDAAYSIPVNKATYPAAGKTDTIFVKMKKIETLNATFDNNSMDYSYAYSADLPDYSINPTVSDNAFQTTVDERGYSGVRFDYILEAGKTYCLTMKYRITSKTSTGDSKLVLDAYAANSNNNYTYRAAKIQTLLNEPSVSVSDTYTTQSFEFTPTDSQINDTNKYFAFVFYCSNGYRLDIAIDNVTIGVAGGSVSFVNESGTTISTSSGINGMEVEFPKAEAGYVNEFYLDEAYSIPVDRATYPAAGETKTIYVKTKKIQVLNATFDNNSQDYSYAYTNPSQGINPTVADNAFQTTVNQNHFNGVRFDYVLEAGKTYRATMKYRITSTTSNEATQLTLNVYAASSNDNSGYITENNPVKTVMSWTNVSVSNNYTEQSFEFTPTASHITDINKYFALAFYGSDRYTFNIAIDSVVVKEVAATPSKPIVEAQTQNSVTLKLTEGYQYRINGGNWQKSNVFTGLYANTDYKFEQRIPETDTYATAASEALTYAIVLNGDTNADKHISTDDLTLLRTYLVGSADDSYNQFGGDSNSDGGVDLRDVVNLKKKVSAPMKYYQSQTTLAEQYYPVFIDNFDGSTLDASRWTVVPYKANLSSELGHQVHMGYHSENNLLEIKDGILTLKMAKEISENGETIYHGSEIRALNKTDFSHGYVEMRAKLAQGTNLWNSFWLTGETRNPVLGEIDIFETLGINSLKPNIHLWWNADAQELPTYLDKTGHWSKEPIVFWENEAGFHTYGLEWTDEKIVWYIDGVAKHTVNYGTDSLYDEFKNGDPLYLILSLSTGRNSLEVTEKILAETLEVDYIRIYQK